MSKKALMITDSNQALFAKKSGCRLQEVLLKKGSVNNTYKGLL